MLEGIRLDEELVSKTGRAFALSGFESPAFRWYGRVAQLEEALVSKTSGSRFDSGRGYSIPSLP